MNTCKGICLQLEIKKFNGKTRYENNQKRCPQCSVFIDCPNVRCPCCRCVLRKTPRAGKSRKLFQERKNESRY